MGQPEKYGSKRARDAAFWWRTQVRRVRQFLERPRSRLLPPLRAPGPDGERGVAMKLDDFLATVTRLVGFNALYVCSTDHDRVFVHLHDGVHPVEGEAMATCRTDEDVARVLGLTAKEPR